MPVDKFVHIPKFFTSSLSKIFLGVFFSVLIIYSLFFSAPEQFPKNDMVVIPSGVSIKMAGNILEDRKIIRSPALFTILASFWGGGSIQSGGYLFDSKESVLLISFRVAKGLHNLETIRVTFPEGLTLKEIASSCAKNLPLCDENKFLELGRGLEGYLFPDTYFFLQSADAAEVIKIMKDTFDQKIATLDKEMRLFGKPTEEIVTMASILEKEGLYFEDRQMIASVLWKRLQLEMLLQVDATLDYALNKNTYELTTADLATTSPYNTYKQKGLPPTPIANPGLESIKAAISPKPTKYLYYLTSKGGKFYFAETHEKHVSNKQLYLNSF